MRWRKRFSFIMPQPQYILCCESVSHDKVTNLLSCFHVLEGYIITRGTEPIPEDKIDVATMASNIFKLVGVAVWRTDETDTPERDMEYQLSLAVPEGDEVMLREGEFRMTKQFHRFTTKVIMPSIPAAQSGDMVFISKVRAKGEQDWLTQRYTIPLTVNVVEGFRPTAEE